MTPATLALQTAHGGKFTVITIFEISALERQPKKLPMQLMIFSPMKRPCVQLPYFKQIRIPRTFVHKVLVKNVLMFDL